MIDCLETMVRAVRPYETAEGEANRIYDTYLNRIVDELLISKKSAVSAFEDAVHMFNDIPADRSVRRPRVVVLGEILVKLSSCRQW